MVIDMNESQVRTLAQVREVLAGTAALEFQGAQDQTDASLRPFVIALDHFGTKLKP